MWADRYDRDLTDIFGIQTAVAEEIAGALRARLSAAQRAQIERKPTQSSDAYDLYLRALEYAKRPGYYPEDLEIAERLYREATQKDSSFALARASLASLLMTRYQFVAGTPDTVVAEAGKEAEQAVRLQPDLPEAHLALAHFEYWGRYNYERALQELETARPGLPAETINLIGAIQRRQGKFDDAIRSQYDAVRIDPRSPRELAELTISLLYACRYEEADRVVERALAIAPNFAVASVFKALIHEKWKGDTELAKAVLREARGRLDPQGRLGQHSWVVHLFDPNPQEALALLDTIKSESIISSLIIYPKTFLSAGAHEAIGDATRAMKEYESSIAMLEAETEQHQDRPFQRMTLARGYAALGRKEEALREARRAVETLPIAKDALYGSWLECFLAGVEARVGEKDAAIERIGRLLSIPSWLSPAMLRIEPRWAPLRNDPRFRKLAELERE
jgi:tetratricopeptide (TPR) repeat protein